VALSLVNQLTSDSRVRAVARDLFARFPDQVPGSLIGSGMNPDTAPIDQLRSAIADIVGSGEYYSLV
jgi:hypothetical protein